MRALVRALCITAAAAGLVHAEPILDVRRVEAGAVRIDGRLDEPAWGQAAVGGGFVERVPRAGAVPPVATEVRVLQDDEAIYFGVTMSHAPGEAPRALQLTRDDTRIWDDDAVTLKFDVLRDRRTTVGFAVNPAGAQLDFVALENGATFRLEYDALWESATSGTDTAWIAEVRLPFVALGLSPGAPGRLVGFDVSRDHAARRATYDWALLPPEFGPMSARHYGALRGLEGLSSGMPVTVVPFALASVNERSGDFDPEARAGGDLRLRLARDLWTELTIFTDFAQTDIDDAVTNLDRFPLFLPEKRAFFLAGLDAFDFGHPAHSDAQLFFSRRIGLDAAGREVPILAGLKQYGHAGPLTIGLLDVVTLDTSDVTAVNWSVARISTRVGRGGEIGAIGTLRSDVPQLGTADDPDAARPLDGAAGVDGSFVAADGRLQGAGFVAGSRRASPGEQSGTAARIVTSWTGDELQPELGALLVSDDFDPPIGFVRRPGLARLYVDLPWVLRAPTPTIDKVTVDTTVYFDGSDELDRLLGRGVEPSLDFTLRSGWYGFLGAETSEDLVEEAFEVVPGVVVPAARYVGTAVYAGVGSPANRTPTAFLKYVGGNSFFGGVFHKVVVELSWAPSRHLRLSADTNVGMVDLPYARDFTTATLNAHVTLALTTDLFADVIAAGENVSDTGVLYARLRWRYRPGSDLFLVYREDAELAAPYTHERTLTLKIALRLDAMLGG